MDALYIIGGLLAMSVIAVGISLFLVEWVLSLFEKRHTQGYRERYHQLWRDNHEERIRNEISNIRKQTLMRAKPDGNLSEEDIEWIIEPLVDDKKGTESAEGWEEYLKNQGLIKDD